MAKHKKSKISILNIIVLVLGILAGATGGFYLGESANVKGCAGRMELLGAPQPAVNWVCEGIMPSGR